MPNTWLTKTISMVHSEHLRGFVNYLLKNSFVLSNTTCNCQPLISWKGYNFKEKNGYNWKAMREISVTITNEQARMDGDEEQNTFCSSTIEGAISTEEHEERKALLTEGCPTWNFGSIMAGAH